jgi:hypothetical protein
MEKNIQGGFSNGIVTINPLEKDSLPGQNALWISLTGE